MITIKEKSKKDEFLDDESEEEISESENKVNINKATKSELMKINGVGEQTANKIIEYRSTNSFNEIEDIMNVSGIGESIFNKIKPYITVE